MLDVEGLHTVYYAGRDTVPAVRGIDLHVARRLGDGARRRVGQRQEHRRAEHHAPRQQAGRRGRQRARSASTAAT